MATLLQVTGLADRPGPWDFAALAALPSQVQDVSTIAPDRRGGAVTLAALLSAVGPRSDARYITLESSDGAFSASVPLSAVADEGLLLYRLGDAPLPEAQGGPVRFLVPNVEACGLPGVDKCSNVKFLARIHLSAEPGRDSRPRSKQTHQAIHPHHA